MKVIELSGIWDFVVDLDPKYHTTPFYASPKCDRSNWEKVVVPGVWNLYKERYAIYEGVCWYAKTFYLDDVQEKAILRFGGVNYRCDVYLNGEKAGTHEGGYTEFVIDVTGLVKKGENYLAVKVDNRSLIMRMPAVLGWFNYGGIHRDVRLELYGNTYLSELFVSGSYQGTISVKGRVETKKKRSYDVEIEIGEVKKKIEDIRDIIEISFEVPDAKVWSPEEPNLYHTKIKLLLDNKPIDEREVLIGFRSIKTEGRDIIFNGKKRYLKGVCYLYDSPVYGLVMKREQYLKDLTLIKELGVDIIRSHFPFTDEFLTECDKQGIMVWLEVPIYCIYPGKDEKNTVFSDSGFKSLALSMMEEMIRQSRNHPSVVIYGIGNECNVENPEAEGFFRDVAGIARKMDSSRLLSYASLYGEVGPLADIVDVIGMNEYWGWYDVIDTGEKGQSINLDKLKDKLKGLTLRYEKPIVISEFAADAILGYISEGCELWSEDYYSGFLEESFDIFREYPVCGTFPFCFNDYKDPSKYINRYWNGMNYKGLVSYNRVPKKPYYTLKDIYKKI
ncbi:MAG: beta galactosidase jelly roll domain-containing protein [Candidatus Omnitrophica bacterium]|nr:beta galactosidase jelly roll domain-containing protein [Candidatus Omnitrophota bacterium]